jgi:sugar transferase (PEP-CTERM/EpsH1 system associated)
LDHLLFLVHRIPFPPDKGDKIRSCHLLKHLAQRYHVHLGTFIDDADDWQHTDTVSRFCRSTHFAALRPLSARLRSLGALACNRALSVDYYRDAGLQSWVSKTLAEQPISKALVFSSAMGQYAYSAQLTRRVADMVDVDSDKWRQYSEKKQWPMRWLYRREGRQLLRYEQQLARDFDASLFVSQPEARLFRELAPQSAAKIGYFNNGVDIDYFSPAHVFPNPYPPAAAGRPVIVFTGAMDYWPNIDAVEWFARDILPAIQRTHPAVLFAIVGARPSPQVQALASLNGVMVTGTVPDVRPYLAHASLAVAPLRIARGIQNKVLEAMAMAKPVLVSPQALEGIDAVPGQELALADDAEQFVERACALLQDIDHQTATLGSNAREKITTTYRWAAKLATVDALLDSDAPAHFS